MQKRDIIVVGASAGGLPPLLRLVAGLPSDLDASVFILRHFPGNERSMLAELLSWRGTVRVTEAIDNEPIEKNRIYVAPSDLQMLLLNDCIVLKPPTHIKHSRPTIDALFFSAANAFGARVIGIILSGSMDDGARGLSAIRVAGGISIVQEPADAAYKDMPTNALRLGPADFVVPADYICAVLLSLV